MAGTLLSPREFDVAEWDGEGERYELINGVLVVSPPPLEQERDPNEELGYLLRLYKEQHPLGAALDRTLPEQLIRTRRSRRRADRVIWAELGRRPRHNEVPTIAAEFVSKDKRDWTRDFRIKKREYEAIGIKEYWIFDRFRRTMTVFVNEPGRQAEFELLVGRLLAAADYWEKPAPKRPGKNGRHQPKKN
jgi:Uma2 family endonuclease